jgi:hypothetical protein
MTLWNDYEGKTIAEAYPLKKLLRPEGRSAFFTTSEPDGTQDVIRLTESAHDQEELLARWRQVTEVDQPNLVTIKTFGKTTFDGVPLTYALMESTDASLAEILRERPLTPAETLQVATSVTAALRALHQIGLTHERIEPASIHASGETIKLRSDCVRECVADPEFNPEAVCEERRHRDIRDLGVLLLRCLTLEQTLKPGNRLPAPFDQVIPHAIDGSWSLAQIADTLTPPAVKPLVPASVLAAATRPQLESAPAAPHQIQLPLNLDADSTGLPLLPTRHFIEHEPDANPLGTDLPQWARNGKLWLGLAAALLFLFLATHFHHPANAVPAAIPSAAAPVPVPAVARPTAAPLAAAPSDQPGWRVISFTYNREPQAFAKVAEIQKRHPELNAQVFSQHGHAPYLVALGGPMSQAQADAMRNRARRDGLPRDTFIRLYGSR